MTINKPFVVGAFTLGGLALGVLAILLFGGTRLFATTIHVVVVFDNSVAGLEIGSAVTFRGVGIGKVEGMQVQVSTHDRSGTIPVYLALDPKRISWTNGAPSDDHADLKQAIAAGLRAQLSAQSLVTGLLSVDLDFHPGAPAVPARMSGEWMEIPTIASDVQNFKDQLRAINLPEIAAEVRQTLSSLQHVLDTIDKKVEPLATSLHSTLDTTQAAVQAMQVNTARTLRNIDQLASESREQIALNGKDLDQLLRSAERSATQAEQLVATLNELTSKRSPLRSDLQASLRDLAASASALRTFTHNLERNPAGTLLHRSSP